MKKKLISIVIAGFFIFGFLKPQIILAEAGEQIDSIRSNIEILQDGYINIEEIIKYDFGSNQKHGIFRNIPYIKKNKDGKKYKMTVSIKSVVDENGQKYNYTTSTNSTSDGEDLVLKIGDADKTITGKHTYIIRYSVAGALAYFSDHDELYWNIVGTGWEIPIKNVTANITFPPGVEASDLDQLCFMGSLGSKESCLIRPGVDNIGFASSRQLSSGEGLTVVLSFPKGAIAVLEPELVVSFWETLIGKIVIIIFGLLALFWYLLYPIWIPIKWYLHGRDPDLGPAVTAYFDAPKTAAGDDLTPGETGALIDESVHMHDITATLVDLARRGYFVIEEKEKKDFYFKKNKVPAKDAGLKDFEKKLMDGLFSGKDEIKLKDQNLFQPVADARDLLYKRLVSEQFFPKNPNSTRNFYYLIAVLGLSTGSILLGITAFIFGRIMPKKTLFGSQEAQKARGLRNFLKSQERQLEFEAKKSLNPAEKQVLFERLLPFAVAFGVEKIWAERFKDINLKPPDWYHSSSRDAFNSVLLVNSLSSGLNTFTASATPTTSSSGFSSGFSGGGSSGGGGGGGGGGSW